MQKIEEKTEKIKQNKRNWILCLLLYD